MSFTSRVPPLFGLLLVAAALQLVVGCQDNISCVFTTGCTGAPGGPGIGGGNPALAPENGLWILDGPPEVVRVTPIGSDSIGTTPIVVVFSESMNADSLFDSLAIRPIAGNAPGPPVTGIPQVLVGDGRVLILLPQPPNSLPSAAYIVEIAQGSTPFDITGQALETAPGVQIGSFQVIDSPPDEPRIVEVYPGDIGGGQSNTTEIVTVFDRPVVPSSVNDASFQVFFDGADPLFDPAATQVTVNAGGLPTTDARAFTWRSVANQTPVPILANTSVTLTLSPLGAKILDFDGDQLAPDTSVFQVIPFTAPLSASLMSLPMDGIGLPALTPGPTELDVQIDLLDAEPGDNLDLFLFGMNLDTNNPQLIALRRLKTLTGTGTITTASYSLAEADLTSTSDPTSTRFADGTLAFAFRLRRGAAFSTLRVLDTEPATAGILDPLLDTTAPTILELTAPGMGATDSFLTDQRDLVLTGRASERVRSVLVTANMGALDNGNPAPVVGSGDTGGFIAKPIALTDGIVAGGTTDFTAIAFDGVDNASPMISGTLRQLGVMGPTPFVPGTVNIEVYDALTLLPLQGARVMLHGDQGDGINFPLQHIGFTLADGTIPLVAPGAPTVATLITVDLAGYDLFTFHGIPTTEVSIPLQPTGLAPASSFGTVSSLDDLAALVVPSLASKLEDTRRPETFPRTFDTLCNGVSGQLACLYGPEPIRPGRLGAQSFLSGQFMLSQAAFSATQVLQAFCLELPQPLAQPGVSQDTSFELPFVLIDPAIDPSEIPVELQAAIFDLTLATGINLGSLDADPTTMGDPRITVEAISPGVPGTFAVGIGLSYDQGGDVFDVRSALAGAAAPGGFFEPALDTDPFLRCEVRDTAGSVSGGRPRVSGLALLPVANRIFAPPVTLLLAPAPGAGTGGSTFGMTLTNSILDAAAQAGLYRVQVFDSAGRGWTLWRCDPPGPPLSTVQVRFPDVVMAGGNALTDGPLAVFVSSFAWPGLDPTRFLWSDVEREHDLYTHAPPVQIVQP